MNQLKEKHMTFDDFVSVYYLWEGLQHEDRIKIENIYSGTKYFNFRNKDNNDITYYAYLADPDYYRVIMNGALNDYAIKRETLEEDIKNGNIIILT
jgi:hypothetical protein